MVAIEISKIIRSRRRTITLQVCRDAALVVRAPFNTGDDYIRRLVEQKRAWISGKQALINRQRQSIKPKAFTDGEEFLYLGGAYKLYLTDDRKPPLSLMDAFYLSKDCRPGARQLFLEWYKKQAKNKVTERVNLYSTQAGLKPNKIKITNAQKRWGSCSRDGNLSFSWRLIMAPLPVIDYVVAHEVAHLEHHNHSRRFWNKVAVLSPHYKQHRKWLRANDHLLSLQ
ncbi:MAG: SprT family zinc-dependent metalloprotease [Planctomycetota bacterium]